MHLRFSYDYLTEYKGDDFDLKKIMLSILCMTIVLLMFIGCNRPIPISYDAYEEFIIKLENMGYTIELEDVEESILLGERKWLTVDGSENISVYLYESNEKMEKDASYLSEDGFNYNNGKKAVAISWISYPHFF